MASICGASLALMDASVPLPRGAVTGDEKEPGINGALMQRQGTAPEANQALNGFACTMGVENYDLTEAKIIENGGRSHCPNMPCLEWLGKDTILIRKAI